MRVLLQAGATPPTVGDPLVVPVSAAAPDGVLGIVTAVKSAPGDRLIAVTRPATLDQAYSQLRIQLPDATLAELGAIPSASASAGKLFTCTGSGPAPNFDIASDFSKLKPQFTLDIGRPEIFFLLSGTAELGVDLSSKASASCKYTGNAKFVIPIAGTPVVITIKPSLNGSLSGEIGAGFTWSPRIALGMQKGPGVDQSFHTFNKGVIGSPSFHGSAQAKMFLGVSVGVSVAERAGVEGTAGPQVSAGVKANGDSVCLDADASLHADLNAYADVFIKRWSFTIAKGDFGHLQLLHVCKAADHPSHPSNESSRGGSTNPRSTQLGPVTIFPMSTGSYNLPWDIAAGPDGNMWFTDHDGSAIGRITTSGSITEFALPDPEGRPMEIAAAPDGNLWFTDPANQTLGRVTTTGSISEYDVSKYPTTSPTGVTGGPDGNVWYTFGNGVAKRTPGGEVTEYHLGNGWCGTTAMPIVTGPDGALWFTSCGRVGRITTGGAITYVELGSFDDVFADSIAVGPDGNLWVGTISGNTPVDCSIVRITPGMGTKWFPLPDNVCASSIAAGPDGNLWIIGGGNGLEIERMTTAGQLTGYPIPLGWGLIWGGVAAGPDGNIWFSVYGGIARVTL
ncbi:MAG TPA: hypothetical protein VF085_07545 [Solirubrobacterales bacterium]